MCHATVRFLAARDRSGTTLRFAPLGGATFAATVSATRRDGLPDSIVLVTADGDLLTRSRAVLHALRRLGGLWRVLATILAIVPRAVADLGYDAVAALRHRLFARPDDACPVLPADLRERFDD
jgi:predicted DCC family thiol-disulfide oxidoreductase YuxK